MAAHEKYSAANLMLLIWTSAARKGLKPDFSGLRKLAIEVAEGKGSNKPLFNETYLDKKFTQAGRSLENEGGSVSARQEYIQALAEFAGYPRLTDFFTKATALFQLLDKYTPPYDISLLSKDDQATFLYSVNESYQKLIIQNGINDTGRKRVTSSIFRFWVQEGNEPPPEQNLFFLRFSGDQGYLDARKPELADPFPIDFMAIAISIYLTQPGSKGKIDTYLKELNKPNDKTQSAMRYLPAPSKPPPVRQPDSRIWKQAFFGTLLLLAISFIVYFFFLRPAADRPGNRDIEAGLMKREQQMKAFVLEAEQRANGSKDTLETTRPLIQSTLIYDSISAYYRNYYGFTNGYTVIEYQKNIEPVIEKDIDKLTPWNKFSFVYPMVTGKRYISEMPDTSLTALDFSFGLIETVPAEPTILNLTKTGSGEFVLRVRYKYPLRYLSVRYELSEETGWYKTRNLSWVGFLPEEKLVFQKRGNVWEYTGLGQ